MKINENFPMYLQRQSLHRKLRNHRRIHFCCQIRRFRSRFLHLSHFLGRSPPSHVRRNSPLSHVRRSLGILKIWSFQKIFKKLTPKRFTSCLVALHPDDVTTTAIILGITKFVREASTNAFGHVGRLKIQF